MKTKQEIFSTLQQLLSEMFEVPPESIVLTANLNQDLDIDSIDAVDLMVRLRDMTGKRINPEDFKNAHTLQDVVEIVYRLTTT